MTCCDWPGRADPLLLALIVQCHVRELADALSAFLFETTGEVVSIDANYIGKLERGVHRWPNDRYRRAFRAILGVVKDAELGFYVDAGPSQHDRDNGDRTFDPAAFADAAAMESVRHAAECDGLVDEVNIELLQEELKDLAGRYHQLDPMNVLVEARLARDLAYALGERTRNVAQVADLHLIAGVACGLLAVGSFDLGLGGPAARQVRAAAAYARLLGHTGLRTWAAGTTALIANWAGQPKEALKSISEAAQSGTGGIGSARLHAIEARAWSLLGDAPQVHAALATADASLDAASGDDDLYDDVGGELGWGISIHSACAGTALLAINDAELAARRIRIALDTWPVDPCGGMVAERARVDLAAAELAGGHFDALLASLDEVWAVPATLRRHGLVARLAHLRLNLRGAAWHDHRPAAELSERIEVFCRESAAIPEIA